MSSSLLKNLAIGTICLAIGIAGSAGAASLITGSNIKDGSIGLKDLSRSARRALKGARGPQGAKGPAGTNGAPGGPGTSGSTAPSLVMGTSGVTSGATRFIQVLGGSQNGSEPPAQSPVPQGTGLTARDFSASVDAAPGGGQSVVVAFRLDGADTALTCTISGTATSCTAPSTATVALPAGGRISMRVTASGSASSTNVGWGLRVVF